MTAPDALEDLFLGGRVRLLQPVAGYRAATDPVLLAASVSVPAAARVLDLGCGVGTAALCLAARLAGLELHGLEVQPAYAALARRNAALNGVALTVHEGDLHAMPAPLRALAFDAVMLNPPWHEPSGAASPDPGKDRANRRAGALEPWIDAALARTRPGGQICLIQRAEHLPEILVALAGRAGDIAALPLAARAGRPAKRVLVKARKGARAPFRLAAPLVLHSGERHVCDGDDYSPAARAILREGRAIEF